MIRLTVQKIFQGAFLASLLDVAGALRVDRCIEGVLRLLLRRYGRRLHPLEIHEAMRVFGETLPYERVRVFERSPLATVLAALSNRFHLVQERPIGVTVFYTIHFNTALAPVPGDMPWLVHELAHVWQYVHIGPRYLAEALAAQARYGPSAYEVEEGVQAGWAWEQFNVEQQAELARACYRALTGEGATELAAYSRRLRGRG